MNSDIVNRIMFEFEYSEALEIYEGLPTGTSKNSTMDKFKDELWHWLDNQGAFDEHD